MKRRRQPTRSMKRNKYEDTRRSNVKVTIDQSVPEGFARVNGRLVPLKIPVRQ